jgi:hypothetical protein
VAAESAVRVALAQWDEAGVATVAPGGTVMLGQAGGTLPGNVTHQAAAERLYRGVWLLHAVATAGGRASAAAFATITALPHDAFWADFHSALVSGGPVSLLPGTRIDGTAVSAVPAPWTAADCPPSPAAPLPPPTIADRPAIALDTSATLAAGGAALAGQPAVLTPALLAAPADFARLGALDFSELVLAADQRVSGSITFAPALNGAACDSARIGNAGAPEDRAHACFDHFPLLVAAGDLTLSGGSGQGVLAVAGDLTVAPGVHFFGAVLVRGHTDAADLMLEGALRSGRGARLGGRLHYSTCALGRAFGRAPALRKVYRHSPRWWLPPL